MGFFQRLRQWLTGNFASEPATPSPTTEPIISSPRDTESDGFPTGWKIAGLYHQGDRIRPVNHDRVTDGEISAADAIIVAHTDSRGIVKHRTIHGADGKDKVADLIIGQTMIYSPVSE